MPRQRLTWRSKKASPPPQVPTVGQTEEPSHPAYYPDPEIDQYQTGDTSSWAEDPNPGPYPTPGSIPPAVPGNLTTEEVDHPAFILKQANFRRQAHERARVCVRIASALLPTTATEDMIERKALDLMDFDTRQLRTMLASLLRQAEDEEDDEGDEEDMDEEDEEETASKKASVRSKKARKSKKASRRVAEDEADEAVEDDEVVEDEDYSDEEEEDEEESKEARKKASRLAKALTRLAEDDEDDEDTASKKASLILKALQRMAEDEEDEEEKEARKHASRKSKRASRRRVAEDEEVEIEEDEEETASKKASLRLAHALRRIAAEEEEDEEVEVEEETASKKASRSARLAKALHRLAEDEEEKESSKKASAKRLAAKKLAAKKKLAARLADARQRKSALAKLKLAMKSTRGRKLASEFFGMDEGDIRSCMRAEEEDIMACEMEAMDLDGDGVDQDSPFYGYTDPPSSLAMMDDEFMVEDDLGDGMMVDDMEIMSGDDEMEMEAEEDMDLVAMLRSISASDEEDEEDEGVSKEAMQPRAKTPQNGDGGNVNPSPVAKTPEVAGPMVSKSASDPMGLMDAGVGVPDVSDADLDLLFGNGGMSHLAEEETEEDAEAKTASKKTAGRKRTASKGPKTLGTVALSPKVETDEISRLSQLWDSAPDITPLLRRR